MTGEPVRTAPERFVVLFEAGHRAVVAAGPFDSFERAVSYAEHVDEDRGLAKSRGVVLLMSATRLERELGAQRAAAVLPPGG